MAGMGGVSTSAAESFARDNDALVLLRARSGIWLGALTILAFIPVDYVRMPDVFREVTTFRVLGVLLLLAMLPYARRIGAERSAVGLAAWVVTILSAIMAGVMSFSTGPSDPAYGLQVVGVILLVLGGSLLVPVDGARMFALASIPLLFHAAVSFRFPILDNLPYVFATFVAVIIASIGAHATYVMRFAEYERRVSKEALLTAHEDFVAMISHDIRNPIGVIQGYASILRESGSVTDEEAVDCLRRLESAAASALLLANNVLYAARLESRPPKHRRDEVQLRDLVDRALDGQQLLVELKRIRLVMEVDEDLPMLTADAGELERVFANLLNNAIKFTPEGGEVRVRARKPANGMLAVEFEDGGEGIPAGREEKIFERFTNASDRRDSTGLGLYLSRSIVKAHAGQIYAENLPGRGARFVVRLPIV